MLINKICNLLRDNIPFGFARFNDGEIKGIKENNFTASRGAQVINGKLKNQLLNALKYKSKNYWVGIPCPNCYPELFSYANNIVGEYEYKTSAVELINKNFNTFITKVVPILGSKNLHWVGGEDQNPSNLAQLNLRFSSITKVPSREAFSSYEQVLTLYTSFSSKDIVLLSAGPLERVLVYQWFKARPDVTFLGLGSTFDPWSRGIQYGYHTGNLKKCNICN